MTNRVLLAIAAASMLFTLLGAGPSSAPATTSPATTAKVTAILRDPKLNEIGKVQALREVGSDAIIPLCDSMRDLRNVSVSVYVLRDLLSGGRNVNLDDRQRAALKAQIPTLIRVLETPTPPSGRGGFDVTVRQGALSILAHLGKDAAPAMPTLNKLLTNKQSDLLPDAVMDVLQSIGTPAVPVIAKFVNDPNPEISRAALRALPRCGEAVIPILVDLAKDPARRTAAVSSLADMFRPTQAQAMPAALDVATLQPANAAALDKIVPTLRDAPKEPVTSDLTYRHYTVSLMTTLAPKHPELIPVLVQMMCDPAAVDWQDISGALAQIGKPALPQLEKLAGDPNTPQLDRIKATIQRMPPADPMAYAKSLAGERDRGVRTQALWRLMKTNDVSVLPAMAELMRPPGVDTSAGAAPSDWVKRTFAEKATPVLVPMLSDPELSVRQFALMSITGPVPEDALPVLQRLANDPSSGSWAIDVLSRGGAPAASVLVDVLATSKDSQAPYYASLALAKMPAEAKLPQLEKISAVAKSADARRAEFTTTVLVTMRPQANDVLASLLNSGPPAVRIAILKSIDGSDPGLIDPICAAMRDPKQEIRGEAAEALKRCGDAGFEAAIKLLRDENKDARLAAAQVLSARRNDPRAGKAIVAAMQQASAEEKYQLLNRLVELRAPYGAELCQQLMNDPDPKACMTGVTMIRQFVISTPGPLYKLIALSRSEQDQRIREAALNELRALPGTMTSNGAAATALQSDLLPAIIKDVTDTAPDRRASAMAALAMFGGEETDVSKLIVKRLEDQDKSVRVEAAVTLVAFAGQSRTSQAAVQVSEGAGIALANALRSKYPEVREAAAQAVAQGHIEAALPVIKAMQSDANPEVQATGVLLVAKLGQPIDAAPATFAPLLHDSRGWARDAAAKALAEHQTQPQASNLLVAAIGDADQNVQKAALTALIARYDAQLSPPGVNREAKMMELAQPVYKAVGVARAKALQDLGKLGAAGGPVVPLLMDSLNSPPTPENQPYRKAAATALQQIFGAIVAQPSPPPNSRP